MITIQWCYLFALCLIISGCIGGGTHGSIKTYQYQVSKDTLEKAVLKILNSSHNIKRDTAEGYHNDGDSYVSMEIKKGKIINDYTFRYGGSRVYWDTAKMSSLFIAYAWDEEGNGGSEGDGGVTWYRPVLKKKLISLFETEFISKLDQELGLIHTKPK